MTISETEYHLEKDMRRVWKQRVAVIFLLALLMGGTAAVSVTLIGVTLALLVVALVGALVILFAISRLKK
jgi:hypothetical protein